jgi:hypothetical protein
VKQKNGNKSKQWKQWKQKQLKRFKCCKRCKWEAKGLFAQSKKGKVVKDAKDEWIERRKAQISQFFKKLENYVKRLKTITIIGGTMRIFYTFISISKELSQHPVIQYKDEGDSDSDSDSDNEESDSEERRAIRYLKLNNYRVNVNKNVINTVNKTVKIIEGLLKDNLLNVNKVINKIHILNTTRIFFDNLVRKEIFISSCIMTLALIFYALICAGIERNPGPRGNIEVITYSCNGLGDKNKLRNLLLKVNKKVQEGAIIFLQETHIVNTEYLKRSWKNKLISNCISTNSAGVIILFNNK